VGRRTSSSASSGWDLFHVGYRRHRQRRAGGIPRSRKTPLPGQQRDLKLSVEFVVSRASTCAGSLHTRLPKSFHGSPGLRPHERPASAKTFGIQVLRESPVSDSNRRPLPYHGRFRVSRAFTDALRRARNPCKQRQYGVYGRDGRNTVVVDPVDAEWTRCTPRSASDSPELTPVPAEPAATLRVRPNTNETAHVAGSAEPIDEVAGRDDLERELLLGRPRARRGHR